MQTQNVDLLNHLKRPFEPAKVSWRIGNTNKKKVQRQTNNSNAVATKGQMVCYIDARDVMQRLDCVCGINWQCKYEIATESGLLICSIGILHEGIWLWRSNGAGDTGVEPEKGKCSDAFKRAAVLWGIGRYLYEIESPWVDLNENGYLPNNFNTPPLPIWATPDGFDQCIKSQLAKQKAKTEK